MTPPAATRPQAPPPLTLAAAVAGLEALGYAVVAVFELAALETARPAVAVTTGIFFLALSGFLGFVAWRLWRLHAWARAPVVMVQLLQIPVALSFWGGGWTNAVTVGLILLSALVLGGVFHPRSLAALEASEA